MEVPKLVVPRTRTAATPQTYSQSTGSEGAFGVGLARIAAEFGGIMKAEQQKREKFQISNQFIQETIQLQKDFAERQKNAPLGADGFTDKMLTDYEIRHHDLMETMRAGGYSADALDEMELRLLGLRENFVGQAINFQAGSYQKKVEVDVDNLSLNLSQIAGTHPNDINAVEEELSVAIDALPVDAVTKESLRAKYASNIRFAAGLGLAEQDPDAVIAALKGNGGDFSGYKKAVRAAESSGNDSAKAETSSALGRYQFTEPTWKGLVARYPNSGLTVDGRLEADQQEIAMDLFTKENAAKLTRYGLPATDANLYAMHFLGEGNGPKALLAADDQLVSDVISNGDSVVAANKFLKGMTVGEFRKWTARKTGAKTFAADGKVGNSVLDLLDTQQRLQILSRAEAAVSQRNSDARASLDIIIGNAQAAYFNGEDYTGPMPDEAAFAAAYSDNPEAGRQKYTQLVEAKEVGGFIQTIKTTSNADIAAQLEELRPKDTASPTYEVESKTYEIAQQAAGRVMAARKEDAAAYVMQNYPAVADAWEGADTPEKRRIAYAKMYDAFNTLGIPYVDQKPMPKEFAEEMQLRFEQAGAPQKLDMMMSWTAEMGPLLPAGLDQLAKNGLPTEAYIAGLVNSSPIHAATARDVLRGLEILKADKSKTPDYSITNQLFRSELGDAQMFLDPVAAQAINTSALALAVARGADPKNMPQDAYAIALREVLGGMPGTDSGGITDSKTILPPLVSEEMFNNWKDELTDADLIENSYRGSGPAYMDGRPATAEDIIEGGTFFKVAPDIYMIRMDSDGGMLMQPDGSYYYMRISLDTIAGRK